MTLAPRLLAALVSGLLLVVISPPLNLHALHWLSFVPLLWALREGDDRRNVALAYLGGVAGVIGAFSWLARTIVIFGQQPWVVGALGLIAFGLLFAIPYALVFGLVHPLRRRLGPAWVAILPALHVAVEFLWPALFPYTQGSAQYQTRWAWQLVSVTGTYGLSYLILLTNCAAAEVIYRRREGGPAPTLTLALTAALWLAVQGFGAWRYPQVEAAVAELPTLRISQLQLSQTMERRLEITNMEAMIDWTKISSELVHQDMDLLVWPEGALLYDPHRSRISRLLTNLTDNTLKAPILFGGRYDTEKRDPETGETWVDRRNSVYLVDQEGVIRDRYDKMVPLPFGEYIPLVGTFPWLRKIFKSAGDFRPGERPVVFELPRAEGEAPVRFSTPICYEMILGSHVRENLSDVDLLINVTNDGWFGDTAAPHQHAMLSAVRSAELGIPTYRLAYTGVSMTVSPSGRLADYTQPFERVSRVIEVPYGRIPTIYARFGDVFAWICAAAAAVGLIVARLRSERS